MILLPIEPNLKKLQEIFIFEYSKYKKIELDNFDEKKYKTMHEVLNVFEQSDSLRFMYKDLGTKKEPLFSRYLFYKTMDNHYFIARLDDQQSLYDFVGVTKKFNELIPVGDMNTKIFKIWKEPLKRFITKRSKKGDNSTVRIF